MWDIRLTPDLARQHEDSIIPLIKFLLIFSLRASVSSVSKGFFLKKTIDVLDFH